MLIYLRSVLAYEDDCSKEIGKRIGRATEVLSEFENIWKSKSISTKTKRDIEATCVLTQCSIVCMRNVDNEEKG